MILSGPQILNEVERRRIVIDPFDTTQLNPNSYNYRLGGKLRTPPNGILDPKQEQVWDEIDIPEHGIVLFPSRLYLGHTLERMGSDYFVTSLIGRSSIGRLGLYVQLAADLGHTGAIHNWTLELVATQPIRLYKGMILGQVSFWQTYGDIKLYSGKYGTTPLPLESQKLVE